MLDGIVNQEIEVTVAAGTVSCQEALGLVNTYYNHPPVPPQGSGGFVQIRSWTCSSASGGTSSEPATPGTAPDPRART